MNKVLNFKSNALCNRHRQKLLLLFKNFHCVNFFEYVLLEYYSVVCTTDSSSTEREWERERVGRLLGE